MDPSEAFALFFVGPHAKASASDRRLLLERAAQFKGKPLNKREIEVLTQWHRRLVVDAASLDLVLKGLGEIAVRDGQPVFSPSSAAMEVIGELTGDTSEEDKEPSRN